MSTLLGRALTMLGALAILSCTGIIVLAGLGKAIPDVLQSLAVGSMSTMGALLARGGGADQTPEPAPGRPETPRP